MALVGGLLRAKWEQDKVERFVEALTLATGDDEPRKRIQIVALTAAKQEQDAKTTGWTKLESMLGASGRDVVRLVREWLGMVPTAKPATKTKKRARRLDPYQPFPIEALPDPVAEYVRQGSVALGCDPGYLALPALCVMGSLIGNTRVIRLKGTWQEPSVFWSVIVGDSGTLKSPACTFAVKYLWKKQEQMLKAFQEAEAAYLKQLEAFKAAKKDGSEGAEPLEPTEKSIIADEFTVEKLITLLGDNPRGILVAKDELSGWFESFKRYRSSSDLPYYLSMHGARSIYYARKGSKSTFVPRAAVSITGGIPPGPLARALSAENLDAGLGARFLVAYPPKLPKRWTEAEIHPAVEQAYHDAIDKLLTLDFDTRNDERVPHALNFSPKAKLAWVAFYNEWALEQAAVEGELAAAFSKLEAYAARFTLIHHVISHVSRGKSDLVPIDVSSVEAGITLTRWFAGEDRRIYVALQESPDQIDTRRLCDWIQARGGRTTAKDLQHSNSRKYTTADAAKAALDALVEAGLGTWVDRPTAGKRGRPTSDFVLQKAHDDTDENTPDDDPQPDKASDTPDDNHKPSDDNPRVFDKSLAKSSVFGLSSVSSGAFRNADGSRGTGMDEAVLSSDAPGLSSATPAYQLVTERTQLDTVLIALDGTGIVGLDLETTGLDPRKDRVRLLSLSLDTTDGGSFAYLIDCFAVDPAPLFEILATKELVIHNAAFDLTFLAQLNFTPSMKTHDTMLLAQLLTAGTLEKVSLAACCQRWLNRSLDKTKQKSDWSGNLTEDQLAYAALDVEVLPALLQILTAKIKEAGLVDIASIEHRCLPSLVWMGQQGVALDRDAWQTLAQTANIEAGRLRQELDSTAPQKPGEMFATSWNWDSTQQAQQALELAGCKLENTSDETLAGLDHPLARSLRGYRLASKRGSTYGTNWLSHVADDGRIYPHWRQTGAATGRMSCSDPNMQQMPRGDYRRCIVAPAGRVLVKADYSQIELRIAAKVSGDKALLDAYQRGDDLHTRTARNVLGVEDVTKQHRQLAKALNFGLLYGMGARGFARYAKSQYGMNLTEDEARGYRDAFFKSYPGLAAWHRRVRSRRTTETRTLTGRRILLNDKTPDTLRLNAPVQGTGADGLKLALALLWERRDQVTGSFPVMAVHDEIVVEADAEQADAVAAWLKSAMVEAMTPMIDPVPVEVEVKVSRTWGGGG